MWRGRKREERGWGGVMMQEKHTRVFSEWEVQLHIGAVLVQGTSESAHEWGHGLDCCD